MQTFEIKNRWDGKVLFSAGGETLRDVVVQAVRERADLSGADLSGADLRSADLRSADLRSAELSDTVALTGDRPFFTIGPIGSRSDYIQSFITNNGVIIKTGCFNGSIDDFERAIVDTHGGSNHATEYQFAITLIRKHAELWGS